MFWPEGFSGFVDGGEVNVFPSVGLLFEEAAGWIIEMPACGDNDDAGAWMHACESAATEPAHSFIADEVAVGFFAIFEEVINEEDAVDGSAGEDAAAAGPCDAATVGRNPAVLGVAFELDVLPGDGFSDVALISAELLCVRDVRVALVGVVLEEPYECMKAGEAFAVLWWGADECANAFASADSFEEIREGL